jgi:hypothetical protein
MKNEVQRIVSDSCSDCPARYGMCPDTALDYFEGHVKFGKEPDHLKVLFGISTPQEASSVMQGLQDLAQMCLELPVGLRSDNLLTREQIGRLAMPLDPEL